MTNEIKRLFAWWRIPSLRKTLLATIGVVFGLLTGFLAGPGGQGSGVLSTVLIMAFFWISECFPLALTALIPIASYPLIGITGASETAHYYYDSITIVQLGGFLVAIAVERWKLHQRIALAAISFVKAKLLLLVIASLFVTFILSMWISNTATTLLLYPNTMAIIHQIESTMGKASSQPTARSLLLSISWGASLGGVSTLVGTPTNLLFVRIYKQMFPQEAEVSFGSWLLFSLPTTFLATLLCGVLLICAILIPQWTQYLALPKISVEEVSVLIVLGILAICWCFRGDLHFGSSFTVRGWAGLIGNKDMIDDAVPALLIPSILFLLPARSVNLNKPSTESKDEDPSSSSSSLKSSDSSHGNGSASLKWDTTILDSSVWKEIPWDILVLLGAGIAMASGITKSGLSAWLVTKISVLHAVPLFIAVLLSTLICGLLTQVMMNVSCCSIMLPVLGSVAVGMGVHPLQLMLPATCGCSLAFAFPIAAASNVILLSSRRLTTWHFISTGSLAVLGCVVIFTAASIWWLPIVFPLNPIASSSASA